MILQHPLFEEILTQHRKLPERFDRPDYRVTDTGPDWATGGTWGPEGGVFAAAGLVIAMWYVFRRAPRRVEPNV